MNIAILIPTRNRETQLGNLLNLIYSQIKVITDHKFAVFVMNTSEAKCAIPIALDKTQFFYFHQPSSGYVIPRNQLLSKLDDSYDIGIFIDDDEYPSPMWLEELLSTISGDGVVAVTGPVLPDFQDYDGWMRGIPLYYHNVYHREAEKNSPTRYILGGNVALNLRVITPILGINLFDMRFNQFGGEDACLSRELIDKFGENNVRLNLSAIAYEVISADRLNYQWLVNRSKNTGRALATIRKISSKRRICVDPSLILLKSILRMVLILLHPRNSDFKVRFLLVRLEAIKALEHVREFLRT